MKHLISLFKGYTPVHPKKTTTPFVLSELDSVDCPADVRESFSDFQEVTTYTFHGNVIRFFHQGEDCDTKLQHIACFLHKLKERPVICDILLSPVKKFYPPNKVFGLSHANTGFCTVDKIVIYRTEEWFKVFIHECVHYFKWESVLDKPHPELETLFHKKFHVYEAYCEVCARVLNCCYISAMTRIPFACLYEIECNYAIQHMTNVLHHMDLDYAMIFDPSYDFKEETNLFAYTVVTAILMYANYVPPLRLVDDKDFIHILVKTAKRPSFLHEATHRTPSVTTTMSKLNVDEFILQH